MLHRMELSAAKAPGAADASETVSRTYIWFDCYYACIFWSLVPRYFLGREGGMMGNLVPAQSFQRDGEQHCFPAQICVTVFLFVAEGNVFLGALL